MKSIGWPRASAYGPFISPDGNTVNIVYSRVMIERAQIDSKSKNGPFGTVLVVLGEGNFHKERQRLLDRIMNDPRWIVRDLPEKPANKRGTKRGTEP